MLPRFRLAEAVRFVDSATMCLFANALTAGVVVHIGFDDLIVAPVIGGRIKRHAVQKRPTVGGHALSKYFAVMLQQTAAGSALAAEGLNVDEVACHVKEQVCEVWRTRLSEHLDHSPFDLAHTLSRTDVQLRRLWVGDAYIELGWERYLPRYLPATECGAR